MRQSELFEDGGRVTVSEYTATIKSLLEARIQPCWIVGEVSNLRRQSSGHLYFSLKDVGAQLPAAMFRGQAARLGFDLQEGMEVVAFGEISVYEPHGRYQFIVREMRESGQGKLFRAFELLKGRLSAEGLFDADRKRPLPFLPLRVAVITSPTGAAVQDFARILKRREWGGCAHVFPCKVQGQGAADEIVRAIELVNQLGGYDVLVLCRGGGSIEDLWCFNEEAVARSVSASSIPTISGIGHEIDFTLTDFAADVRAETPSAAAEMIGSLFLSCVERVTSAGRSLDAVVEAALREARFALRHSGIRLKGLAPSGSMERAFLRLDELAARLGSGFQLGVAGLHGRLDALERRLSELDVKAELRDRMDRLREFGDRLEAAMHREMADRRSRLALAGATLQAIGPEATLRRGFAMLTTRSGRPLTSVAQVGPSDRVRAELRDGKLDLRVEK